VLGHGVLDQKLAPRYGRQSDVRADLDVIAGDVKLAAAEGVDAADRERVGGDAFDACADGVEKATEILDVRLGCRVVDQRCRPRLGPRP